MAEKINWLALESNPDVLNKYIHTLGVPGSKWQFTDVYGTDPDLLAAVPRPVIAVLLLFPITKNADEADEREQERIEKQGQLVSQKLWFMKQTIGNACGTIAVLHSLANTEEQLGLKEDSPLKEFLEKTRSLGPSEKAEVLIESRSIAEAHTESAKEGQTKTPDLDADIDLHFIAFVEKEGHLYELDGRKPSAINHGQTSPDTLLEDSCKVIQGFMSRDPSEYNFSMVALVPASED